MSTEEFFERLPVFQTYTKIGCSITSAHRLNNVGTVTRKRSIPIENLPFKTTRLDQYSISKEVIEKVKNDGFKKASKSLGAFNPLTREIYIHKFKLLLWLEELEWLKELHDSSLKDLKVQQYKGFLILKLPKLKTTTMFSLGDPVLVERLSNNQLFRAEVASQGDNSKLILKVSIPDIDPHEKFNLTSLFHRVNYQRSHFALESLNLWSKSQWLRLFPDAATGVQSQTPLIKRPKTSDKSLNPFQRAAIDAILASTGRPRPYVLFGPPGTGKSRTIVECIARMFEEKAGDVRVLAVANSHRAIDTLASSFIRLKPHLIGQTVRLKSCFFIRRHYWLTHDDPALSNITKSQAGLYQSLSTTKIIFSTCSSAHLLNDLCIKYDFVFIDEASQVTEPEALVPINLLKSDGSLILAGDIMQLRPYKNTFNTERGLGTSLMERILQTKAYKSSYQRKDNKLVAMLCHCYRSDPRLMKVNNSFFYNNRLKFSVETPLKWMLKLNIKSPLLYVDIPNGKEKAELTSPSYFNMQEALMCVELVKLITSRLKVKSESIAVISPYAAQVRLVKMLLGQEKLNKCTVSPIESFQGDERDVIIISTVRTLPKGSSFAFNLKRSNVATSRARCLSFVVCNAQVLKQKSFWKNYIAAAEKFNPKNIL